MKREIRLACMKCDRDDHDLISRAELAKAIKAGWTDVAREQTFAEACAPVGDGPSKPYAWGELDNGSVFFWYTHLGTCPECQLKD